MRNKTKFKTIDKNVIKKFINVHLDTFQQAIKEMNRYAQMREEEEGWAEFLNCLIFEDGSVELLGENMDYEPEHKYRIAEICGEDVWYNEPETVEEIIECICMSPLTIEKMYITK